MPTKECVFCKIVRGEIASELVKETPELIVIKDIDPKAPVHYLIIPRPHLASMHDIDASNPTHKDIMLQLATVIRELAHDLEEPQAFNVISNNGETAGQSVLHLHWHFLSGRNIYDGKTIL